MHSVTDAMDDFQYAPGFVGLHLNVCAGRTAIGLWPFLKAAAPTLRYFFANVLLHAFASLPSLSLSFMERLEFHIPYKGLTTQDFVRFFGDAPALVHAPISTGRMIEGKVIAPFFTLHPNLAELVIIHARDAVSPQAWSRLAELALQREVKLDIRGDYRSCRWTTSRRDLRIRIRPDV